MTNSCTFSARKEVREHIVAYATVTVLAVTLLVVGILARFHLGSLKNVSQLTSNYLMTAGAALIIAEIFVLFIKSFNEQSDKSFIDDKSPPQGAAGSSELGNKNSNEIILESELNEYGPFQPLESYFAYQTAEGYRYCYRESKVKWTINLTDGEIVSIKATKGKVLLQLTKANLELYKKRPSEQADIAKKKLKFEASIAASNGAAQAEISLQPAPLSPSGQVDTDGQPLPKTPPSTPMAALMASKDVATEGSQGGSEGSEAASSSFIPLTPVVEESGEAGPQPTPPQAERSTSLSLSPPSSPGSRASTAAGVPAAGLFPVT